MDQKLYNRVKITGLSVGWNTVTLSSFVTVPASHNTIWIEFDTNSTGTSYGIRKTGSGTTTTFPSNGRVNNTQPVEINGGQIDVNLGNTTNGEAFICWSDDYHTWLASPVNVITGQTGSGTFQVDCTSALSGIAPSDCVGLFIVSRAVNFGPTGNTLKQKSHALIGGVGYGAPEPCPLTAYKAEYYSGGGTTAATDIRLVAYAPKGCFIYPSEYTKIVNPESLTQWNEHPTPYINTSVNNFRWYNGGSSAVCSVRGVGQVGYPLPNYTTPPLSAPDRNNGVHSHEWRPAGANGKVEMFNNSDALNYMIWMGGYVASLATVQILSIDRLTPGLLSTVTLSGAFAATNILINDGFVSKTIPLTSIGSNQWTFTPPVWVDETPGLKYGDVSINVTDGVLATAIYNDTLDSESGFDYVNMEAVGAYNYVDTAGSSPALKIGTQVRFKISEGVVNKYGEYNNGTTGFTGTTFLWDRDPEAPYWTRSSSGVVSSGATPAALKFIGVTISGKLLSGSLLKGKLL